MREQHRLVQGRCDCRWVEATPLGLAQVILIHVNERAIVDRLCTLDGISEDRTWIPPFYECLIDNAGYLFSVVCRSAQQVITSKYRNTRPNIRCLGGGCRRAKLL